MKVGDLVNHIAHGRGIILRVKSMPSWTSLQVFWDEPVFWKKEDRGDVAIWEEDQHICWVDEGDVMVISQAPNDKKL